MSQEKEFDGWTSDDVRMFKRLKIKIILCIAFAWAHGLWTGYMIWSFWK